MKWVLAFLFCVYFSFVRSQQVEDLHSEELEQLMELLSENNATEEIDLTTVLDELSVIKQHPINLNRCTEQDLAQIPFLSPLQCMAIIEHRRTTGRYIDALELQAVHGLRVETVRYLLPFVQVNGDRNSTRITRSNLQDEIEVSAFIRVQRVLEERKGYNESEEASFPGSPFRVLTRHRVRYLNALSAGITMEKDAGETFFGPQQPRGFDFYSAHLMISNQGVVEDLIIGDYQAQFGQGLVVWSGLAFGKSADLLTAKRNARGILPYVSADENNFLRGTAATFRWRSFSSSSFISRLARDASLKDTLTPTGQNVFSAFQMSGVHATENQLNAKDAINQTIVGQHFSWKLRNLSLGLTGTRAINDGIRVPQDHPRRQFDVLEGPLLVGGMNYQWLHKNTLFFGEFATRSGGRNAMIHGVLWSLGKSVDASLVYRKYDPGFQHPLSNSFGEGSTVNNEEGLFLATKIRLDRKWSLRAYGDVYRFPWLRFRADGPSHGKEYWVQLDYRPNKTTNAYLRYRIEEQQRNYSSEEQATAYLGAHNRQSMRLHVSYDLNERISLRNRLAFTWVDLPDGEHERGMLLYQDIIWKPSWPAHYQLKFRYALFDTDGFESRLYAYEHDLRYAFSIPAFADRGTRFYALCTYRISRWGKLSVRLAQTYYSNRDTVGSGMNLISGNTITDIRAQLEVKF